MLLKTITCLALFAHLSYAQIELRPGKCDERLKESVMKDFNAERFLGRWYEIMRYNNFFQSNADDCTTAYYTANPNGTVRVENTALRSDGTRITEVGSAVVSYPEVDPVPGQLNVTFGGAPSRVNYQILDTDYTSYVVVFNCVQLSPLAKLEYLWVMSRTEQFYPNNPEPVDALLDKFFDRERVHVTKQGAACRVG